MTTMRYIVVTCDVCGEENGHEPSAAIAREMAKKEGYARRRLHGRWADLCANCKMKPDSELIWWDEQ